MKIIVGSFKHETNSNGPIPATLEEYKNSIYLWGDEIFPYFKGSQSEIGGILDAFEDEPDFTLIPTCALEATPSGIGPMNVYYMVRDCILKAINDNGPVDGILLSLHGAQVLEETEDGEGDLIEELRNAVGPDVPIMVTLDLHANITEKMVKYSDAIFGYDYYPHTDKWFTGNDAAKCMIRTLKKEIRPCLRFVKLPFLCPYLQTDLPVVKPFVDREHEYEKMPGVLGVNFFHGFFAADIYECGASVTAVTDGDPELAEKIAGELADAIWDKRHELKRGMYTVDEAIKIAKETDKKPVVFADVTDNPGAGAPGDGTHILRRMLELGVKDAAVAMIADPETVRAAEAAGIGATIEVDLGGKHRPDIAGEPIHTKARVKTLSDAEYFDHWGINKGLYRKFGHSAVLEVDGIDVLVTAINKQPSAYEIFQCVGIDPFDKKILVVKSTIHFRASFERISDVILDVEVPGLSPQHPSMIDYKNIRRPIFPLDDI
ncbi:MAG: M81 family metallopeptidase [Firmicutes bacterium]|nr:M81 family metallopeptidase [Bacillota bacterium]